MKHKQLISHSAAAVLALGSATAQARYDERDAKRDCDFDRNGRIHDGTYHYY